MNDSSTGGPLAPAAAPAPLEGIALANFIQGLVVGITGIEGTMVRPSFQSEPPNVPDAGEAWISIRISSRPSDAFPYVGHDPSGDGGLGTDTVQRHEELHFLCSFYDLGTNGQAANLASLLREGLAVAQNREVLTTNGMGLVSAGETLDVPVIVKTRWLYRCDMEVIIRRNISRTYPVRNLLSADITVETDSGRTISVSVTQ